MVNVQIPRYIISLIELEIEYSFPWGHGDCSGDGGYVVEWEREREGERGRKTTKKSSNATYAIINTILFTIIDFISYYLVLI